MEEWLREPEQLRDVLLRRTLRAMIAASGVLRRAALGKGFDSDEQRWACLGLMRLAPALIGAKHMPPEEPVQSLRHPSNTEAEDAVLGEYLDRETKFATREESQQWWLEAFRRHGPFKDDYATEEEAFAHGGKEWDFWKERERARSDDSNSEWRD